MASSAREKKRCAYCGSGDISAGRREGFKLKLSNLTTMWTSPEKPSIVLRPKSRVDCAECGAAYTVRTIGNEETRRLLPAIAVQRAALVNFKSIFGDQEWGKVEEAVTAAAQQDDGTLHIFLALGGKRAYLTCGRVAGRFVMVGVEEARG